MSNRCLKHCTPGLQITCVCQLSTPVNEAVSSLHVAPMVIWLRTAKFQWLLQVCGNYYQGRGQHTHAFTHALETAHHMFMKLEDGRVYCLPDGYEVEDRSLDPIRYVLNPTFAPEKVRVLPPPWSVWIPVLGDCLYRTKAGGTPWE